MDDKAITLESLTEAYKEVMRTLPPPSTFLVPPSTFLVPPRALRELNKRIGYIDSAAPLFSSVTIIESKFVPDIPAVVPKRKRKGQSRKGFKASRNYWRGVERRCGATAWRISEELLTAAFKVEKEAFLETVRPNL